MVFLAIFGVLGLCVGHLCTQVANKTPTGRPKPSKVQFFWEPILTLFSIFWASGFWLFLGMPCETLKSAKLPQMSSKMEAKMAPKSHFAAIGRKRVGYAIYCIWATSAGPGRLPKAIPNPVRFQNPFRTRFLRILAGFGGPCGCPFGFIFRSFSAPIFAPIFERIFGWVRGG